MANLKSEAITNPKLREFSQMHLEQQSLRKILFEQELNMQMRCDFIIEPESPTAVEMKSPGAGDQSSTAR